MTASATNDARTDAPPAVSPDERRRILGELLKSVSRAFYLSLRVLPAGLREPIGLAYLLARAADTVADSRLLQPGERLQHLLSFRRQVEGPASTGALRAIERALTAKQSLPAERALLQSLPPAFAMLERLPDADRVRVRRVVVTLTEGMEMDLTTFPAEDSGRIATLPDAAALDRYTYLVAGCVGEFWTEMLVAHTPALRCWDVKRMSEIGVRFGKALQLTNVLRDVPKDLRMGRCYLPLNELTAAGVKPEELLKAETGSKARPVLVNWLKVAMGHFSAAEEYLLAHPRRCVRLRLAAFWPILIGLATLELLARNAAWLDPTCPSKVTRGWVYRVLTGSLLVAPSNLFLERWLGSWRERVLCALKRTGCSF